jgi:hypothetical protein
MKKYLFAMLVVFGALSLTGCAAIISGKSRNIGLQAQSGDEVKLSILSKEGSYVMTAPGTLRATASNQDIVVTVNDPCYKKTQTVISKKFNWITALDLFASYSSLFASSTDAGTGAMWTYDDNVVVPVVKLETCVK